MLTPLLFVFFRGMTRIVWLSGYFFSFIIPKSMSFSANLKWKVFKETHTRGFHSRKSFRDLAECHHVRICKNLKKSKIKKICRFSDCLVQGPKHFFQGRGGHCKKSGVFSDCLVQGPEHFFSKPGRTL